MKTIENNKLISGFMGATPDPCLNSLEYELYGIVECIDDGEDEKHFFFPEEMLFNESWDWLMPVVEKIESLEICKGHKCSVYIHTNKVMISVTRFDTGGLWNTFYTNYDNKSTKLQLCYKAVVEFIEWYNENK